jgi:hypothetical protein
MWKRPRFWFLLTAIATVALAAYFEPTHCVRGWLRGEAFYQGRPTSYWAEEIQRWEYWFRILEGDGAGTKYYARRPSWPQPLVPYLPEQEAAWPTLLDGDVAGLAVLQELQTHPSEEVRDWARVGIERTRNKQRGPWKVASGSMSMGTPDDFRGE